MNYEAMTDLRNQVAKMGEQFSMGSYWHNPGIDYSENTSSDDLYDHMIEQATEDKMPLCGTSCCIVGEAMILFNVNSQDKVRDLLGLSSAQYFWLAHGLWSKLDLFENDPVKAASAIDMLMSVDEFMPGGIPKDVCL